MSTDRAQNNLSEIMCYALSKGIPLSKAAKVYIPNSRKRNLTMKRFRRLIASDNDLRDVFDLFLRRGSSYRVAIAFRYCLPLSLDHDAADQAAHLTSQICNHLIDNNLSASEVTSTHPEPQKAYQSVYEWVRNHTEEH